MLDTLIKGARIVDGTGAPAETGDLGLRNGQIVARGKIDEAANETIDADGLIATPGWVDVHTHYDGQVTWDDVVDPSASQGVSTVVMGNCGVGFAPVERGGEKILIELMEGVEDIPGTALYEGMPWGEWESFPDYLDFLESRRWALDVGAQLAHGPLRSYVMGQRGRDNEPATQDDLKRMSELVEESMRAGALGFSTSRTIGHRSMSGVPVPGTFAAEEELMALADGMKRAGSGVFELIPASTVGELAQLGGERYTLLEEFELIKRIGHQCGRPMTFTTVQIPDFPDTWQAFLDGVTEENAKGANLRPQVASRPIGFVTGLQAYHMFQRRETYLKIADLPLAERVAEMRKPEVKAAILRDADVPASESGAMANIHMLLSQVTPFLFPISLPIDYEPAPEKMFMAQAAAAGKEPVEYLYDFLLEDEGQTFAIILGSNYLSGNHDVMHTMLTHPHTIAGLSDAGAHVNLIFDAVVPTYSLIHWARDRSRGEKLSLEFVVHKHSLNNANLYGLRDRGSLEVGKRADLNLIDFDNLQLGALEVHRDLPAGGSRVLQKARGYVGTFVAGTRTRQDDTDTGERPGRLVRGG